MATTGKVRSNAIGVYISNTALPDAGLTYAGPTFGDGETEDDDFELIACATSGSFSGSMEVIDATTKDNDGQREILTSALSWSMSCDGLIDYSTAAGSKSATELFDLWKAKTKVRIAWTTGTSERPAKAASRRAPIRPAARNVSRYSMRFSDRIATRSPAPTPRCASSPARRALRRSRVW